MCDIRFLCLVDARKNPEALAPGSARFLYLRCDPIQPVVTTTTVTATMVRTPCAVVIAMMFGVCDLNGFTGSFPEYV
ncbi:MAG: hypothetical protein C0467_18525 [Planctomycetaceae bacterium]|nr:hypothetical protein [Planctomycetaceae bacterium]